MIIVPTDTPGFNLVRNIPVMGHAGEGYFSHAEILYQNCRVPQKNLLGPEGHGFVIAQERLGPGRIHHCMRWIGICNRAFDLMCARARDRIIAPASTLATKQIIQAWIAESAAEIQAARLMVLARRLEDRARRHQGGAQGDLPDQVRRGQHPADGSSTGPSRSTAGSA